MCSSVTVDHLWMTAVSFIKHVVFYLFSVPQGHCFLNLVLGFIPYSIKCPPLMANGLLCGQHLKSLSAKLKFVLGVC